MTGLTGCGRDSEQAPQKQQDKFYLQIAVSEIVALYKGNYYLINYNSPLEIKTVRQLSSKTEAEVEAYNNSLMRIKGIVKYDPGTPQAKVLEAKLIELGLLKPESQPQLRP